MGAKTEGATSVSRSPVPAKEIVQYSFMDAIRQVLLGKRITRIAWADNQEFGLLKDTYLTIHTKGEYHQWIINDGDLGAIDWIILPPQN